MTQAQALEIAVAQVTDEDAKAVLEHMLKQKAKASAKAKDSDTKTKARVANETLADKVLAQMGADAVGTKWLGEHFAPLASPQKATAVMSILTERGAVERVKGRTITWQKVDTDTDTE
jgi:hypothetical protein